METMNPAGPSPAHQWQVHCRQIPSQDETLSYAAMRRAQRVEERWIEELICQFDSIDVRAAALRSIAELRETSIRVVATFFEVEMEVVVRALSLLPADMPLQHRAEPTPKLVKAA